jgi:hypothetical protein
MELESNSPSEEQFTTDVEMDVDSQSGLLVEESGSHAGTAASLPNSDWSDSEIEEDIVDQASSSHAGVIELSDSSDSDIVEKTVDKPPTHRVTLEVIEVTPHPSSLEGFGV